MRSPRGIGGGCYGYRGAAGQEHVDLIPGIPDDVAVDCLARVPHASHRAMRRVCRRWQSARAAPAFSSARAQAGTNEDLVYLMQFGNPSASAADGDTPKDADDGPANTPAYGVVVYNVTTGEWRRERGAPPVVPVFAQCAAVGTRLAVLGGWDLNTFEPVADVHVLDAATGRWRKGAPMRSARSYFACAEAGGKIYVAGGHDKHKNALKTAEAYDAESDTWDPLPDMSEERDECDGMATVAGDRFLAVSGYRSAAGRVRARRRVVRPRRAGLAEAGARPGAAVRGTRRGARPRLVHRGERGDGMDGDPPRVDRGRAVPARAQGRHRARRLRRRRGEGSGHRCARRRGSRRAARSVGVRCKNQELDRRAAAPGVRRIRLLRRRRPDLRTNCQTKHHLLRK